VWVTLTCLVLAAPAAGGDLDKPRASISKKKYADALKALDAASQSGTRLETTLDVLELQGVAHAQLNHAAEARAAFQRLLALAPDRALAAGAGPKAQKLFAEATQWLQQNPPLSFVALPAEAGGGEVKRLAVRVNADALGQARKVQFSTRTPPSTRWETVQVRLDEGRAEARVDGAAVEWFASLLGDRDAELARLGSEAAPRTERAAPEPAPAPAPIAQAAEPAPAAGKPLPTAPAAATATGDAVVFRVTPVQVVVMPTQSQASDQAVFVGEEIARALSSAAFKVTTPSQLAAVMGLERQKQMMGCSDEQASSCVAELANALGADVVVSSTYARSSDGSRCSVVFASGTDGSALERVSVEGTSDSALFERLRVEVGEAASRLFSAKRPGARLEPGKPGVRKYALIPAVAAVAFGIGAAVSLSISADAARALQSRNGQFGSPAEVSAKASSGRLTETLGWVFAGTAVAALVTAGVVFVAGAPTEPKVTLAPIAGAGGGGIIVTGVWP
jgi:hypothetical protein